MDWTGLDWNGMEWTGLDWNGLEWNGLDWTGLEWNGLDWNCYLASLKLSCVCDARDYSHAVYGANNTTQSLYYRITCSFTVKNRNYQKWGE